MPEVRFSLEIPEHFSQDGDEVLERWASTLEEFQLDTPTFPSHDLDMELEPTSEDTIPWGMIWRQEWALAITVIRNASMVTHSRTHWELRLNIPLYEVSSADDHQVGYYIRTRLIQSLTAPFWLPRDPLWPNESRLAWQNILSAAWLKHYPSTVYSPATI